MEKSINLKTEEFKQNLYFIINNSDLPVANAFLIMQTMTKELEELYYNQIEKENQQLLSQQQQQKIESITENEEEKETEE